LSQINIRTATTESNSGNVNLNQAQSHYNSIRGTISPIPFTFRQRFGEHLESDLVDEQEVRVEIDEVYPDCPKLPFPSERIYYAELL
jgi:hypothetical protein